MNEPMMLSLLPAYTSSEQTKPSVSRNHCTVSVILGEAITPWPMRFTRDGPLGSRYSSPARFKGSSPEFRA